MSEHKAELSTVAKMNEGLELNFNTIKGMNKRRQEMRAASNPKNYNDFRVFIMGIKGNEATFGDGLVTFRQGLAYFGQGLVYFRRRSGLLV
jgi:hypothetical protein